MPLHDWTTVETGVYHGFHLQWIAAMTARLNAGLLPPQYYAAPERNVQGPIPDLIAFHDDTRESDRNSNKSGATTLARPKKKFVFNAENEALVYSMRANQIKIKTDKHKVVAVIELVSPGNKSGKVPLHKFLKKNIEFLQENVNVMIIDPFPPGRRDPQGLHALIWEEFSSVPFKLPRGKPYTFASYQTRPGLTAFVEPIGLGDPLPDMPLFLKNEFYIDVPLEETYQATIDVVPKILQPDFPKPAKLKSK